MIKPGEPQDFSNFSMLDLFRMEVETQATILNENLLQLETQGESWEKTPILEALMRAAHSIKGAARIVQIDGAVQIAHWLEECFVAGQQGRVQLLDAIDQLLAGVDLLEQISQRSEAELLTGLSSSDAAILSQLREITTAIPAPDFRKSDKPPTIPILANPDIDLISELGSDPAALNPETGERVVRVSADHLNQLMALAGESLVEAKWLQPFSQSLLQLKHRQQQVTRLLEKLQDALISQPNPGILGQYVQEAQQKAQDCHQLLSDRLNDLEFFSRRFGNLSDRLYQEVIATHLRPFRDGVTGFPRLVRDVAKQLGKQVNLEILGKSTLVDRDILERLEAPLTQILRNAITHGIESPDQRLQVGKPITGTVTLEASHRAGMLLITIQDDGAGIDLEELRQQVLAKELTTPDLVEDLTEAELMEFLFLPGFSTADRVTELAGRRFGLDIAKTMVQEVGGLLRATSILGHGMTFQFQLPLTLSVIRALLVEISGEAYAFHLTRVDGVVNIRPSDIAQVEKRQYLHFNGDNIALITAHQVLELTDLRAGYREECSVVLVSDQTHRYGIIVDRFLGESDLVVRTLDPRLGKVPDISAAALMEDGSLVLILDVADLVRSIAQLFAGGNISGVTQEVPGEEVRQAKRILVVDDSITVREMERKLLENSGYQVDVAVNGLEGWNSVRMGSYDLVISDIDMPRLNGIELVGQIKSHPKLKEVPVIIVSYKDREEDRMAGLQAGANYYLTKASFHDDNLLKVVMDLIGK